MDVVISVISQLGFPIGVCLVLMWYISKLLDNHKNESKEFTEAINKNTLILQQLVDRLSEVLGHDR